MTFDTFIGIDPGKTGAVAAIRLNNGRPRTVAAVGLQRAGRGKPYIPEAMSATVLEMARKGTTVAAVETQSWHRGESPTAGFATGYGAGLWRGILAGLGIPAFEINPGKWQAAIWGRGFIRRGLYQSAKRATLAAVASISPVYGQAATSQAKADAIAIAEYCRLFHVEHLLIQAVP